MLQLRQWRDKEFLRIHKADDSWQSGKTTHDQEKGNARAADPLSARGRENVIVIVHFLSTLLFHSLLYYYYVKQLHLLKKKVFIITSWKNI